jgi:glucose-6-phosphate isomerase
LACGKTVDELNGEKCPENLISHKTFPGDRPSLSILFEKLDPFTCG